MATIVAALPAATARRVRARAVVVLAAVVAPAMVWVVAVPVLGVDLGASPSSTAPPSPVGLLPVVAAAAAASLAGWAALAALERLTRRGLGLWTAAAVVVLLVSSVPLLAPGDTSTASRVVLGLMHVAVAGVLVPGLRSTSPQAAR